MGAWVLVKAEQVVLVRWCLGDIYAKYAYPAISPSGSGGGPLWLRWKPNVTNANWSWISLGQHYIDRTARDQMGSGAILFHYSNYERTQMGIKWEAIQLFCMGIMDKFISDITDGLKLLTIGRVWIEYATKMMLQGWLKSHWAKSSTQNCWNHQWQYIIWWRGLFERFSKQRKQLMRQW